VRLLIAAPIPCLDAWIVAAELPPGFMVLRSISIASRSGKTPGTSLIRGEDIPHKTSAGNDLVPIDHQRVQIERLLAAWARCDGAGRAEVLKIAEVLAGATP
jgi:hypothetical protein